MTQDNNTLANQEHGFLAEGLKTSIEMTRSQIVPTLLAPSVILLNLDIKE